MLASDFHQFRAAFRSENGNRNADSVSIHNRRDSDIRHLNSAVNRFHHRFFPRRHQKHPRFRHSDLGHLRNRRRRAIVVHADVIQNCRSRNTGADFRKFAFCRFNRFLHFQFIFFGHKILIPFNCPAHAISNARVSLNYLPQLPWSSSPVPF